MPLPFHFTRSVTQAVRRFTLVTLCVALLCLAVTDGRAAIATATYYLSSDTTAAGISSAGVFSNVDSTGVTVGSSNLVNKSGDNYVAWNWAKGSTPGFDIETYTGTGVARTINHSLGATPSLILIKSTVGTSDWYVYHQSTGNTGYLNLNNTSAFATDATVWNTTSPTSANFTVGTKAAVNGSGGSYIAYLWTAIPGFSAFGSYTGNGSADGPFVYTGFKPKYILVKRTDSSGDWLVLDTARDTYNPVQETLFPDLNSSAVTAGAQLDSLANGFKIRSAASVNVSTGTYIYAAFADYPFERATTNQGVYDCEQH